MWGLSSNVGHCPWVNLRNGSYQFSDFKHQVINRSSSCMPHVPSTSFCWIYYVSQLGTSNVSAFIYINWLSFYIQHRWLYCLFIFYLPSLFSTVKNEKKKRSAKVYHLTLLLTILLGKEKTKDKAYNTVENFLQDSKVFVLLLGKKHCKDKFELFWNMLVDERGSHYEHKSFLLFLLMA